jgi:metallo-beta-lactamase class B
LLKDTRFTYGFHRLVLPALLTVVALGSPPEWSIPQKPFHIIGNVYFVGTAGLSSYLIATPKGNILLDGGLPESARLIEKNVQTLGFKLRDTRYLLNSHAHYDHCGGLAQLKRDSGAQMVASEADAPVLEAGHHGSYGAGWSDNFPAVQVDRIVHDGDGVELGSTVLHAMVTPGHTKGCTTWTMGTNEGGKNYQVVFYCSTSVPGYPLVRNKEYPNIVDDYRHSFARLQQVHADVFLSNHTEFFDMKEKLARVKAGSPNPFVDPSELQRYVAGSEKSFEAELAKQSKTPPLH